MLAENIDAIRLGIWYHDVKDTEEKSALMLEDHARESNVYQKVWVPAKQLVLATKHPKHPETIDEKIIVDVDLSILGKDLPEFDAYEKNIRKEYAWVDDDSFREGRTKVLQMFLAQPTIYYTDFFQKKYESKARKNLKRSIEQLRG